MKEGSGLGHQPKESSGDVFHEDTSSRVNPSEPGIVGGTGKGAERVRDLGLRSHTFLASDSEVVVKDGDWPSKPLIVPKALSDWAAKEIVAPADKVEEILVPSGVSEGALAPLAKGVDDTNERFREQLIGDPAELLVDAAKMPEPLAKVVAGTAEHLPLPFDDLIEKGRRCLTIAEGIASILSGTLPLGAILDYLTEKAEEKLGDRIYKVLVPQPAGHPEQGWADFVKDQQADRAERHRQLEEFVQLTHQWVAETERAQERRRRLYEKVAEERRRRKEG